MDLTAHVHRLGREFAAFTEVHDDGIESAIRMALLETLSAAADEITRELAPGSAELRLRGRDPYFVVTAPPAVPRADPTVGRAPTVVDGPSARINVRLPELLKAAVEEAAATEGRSVNAWLVRAASTALHHAGRAPHTDVPDVAARTRQSVTGWVH